MSVLTGYYNYCSFSGQTTSTKEHHNYASSIKQIVYTSKQINTKGQN